MREDGGIMKWTRVAEQTPDSQGEMLLYDRSVGCIGIGMLTSKGLLFFPGGHIVELERISHWMLLQAPDSYPPFEGWISTEDRLPEIGEDVVIYVGVPKWCISIGHRTTEGDWRYVLEATSIPRREVSHWMALPDPPQ